MVFLELLPILVLIKDIIKKEINYVKYNEIGKKKKNINNNYLINNVNKKNLLYTR